MDIHKEIIITILADLSKNVNQFPEKALRIDELITKNRVVKGRGGVKDFRDWKR